MLPGADDRLERTPPFGSPAWTKLLGGDSVVAAAILDWFFDGAAHQHRKTVVGGVVPPQATGHRAHLGDAGPNFRAHAAEKH